MRLIEPLDLRLLFGLSDSNDELNVQKQSNGSKNAVCICQSQAKIPNSESSKQVTGAGQETCNLLTA